MFGERRSDLLYQDDLEDALIVTPAKIVAACDELGSPRPEYQVLGYGITLVLHALESAVIRDNKGTGLASANSLNEADEANSDAERDAGSYALEHKIIDLLAQDGSMRQARLANTLGVSRATLQRAMKRLTDARVIKRIGNRRTGTWQVLGSVENLDQDSGRQQ
jgi:predicted HTH transcriptional regulator